MISFSNAIRFTKLFINKWYTRIKQTVFRITVVSGVVIAILWISVFFYTTFYYAYMPKVSHIKPVYLEFSSDCQRKPEEGLCSFPQANLTLIKPDKTELFMPGQPYQIFLEVLVPNSPANQRLGMFMVILKLLARDGKQVGRSARSVMLHYKSPLLQTFYTIIFLPLLLSELKEEKQLLSVNFYDYYLDDAFNPALQAQIQIQTNYIELYEATLNIHAHFTGLRYILFHWPIVSALLGVTSNMIFLSFIVFLSWYKMIASREAQQVVVKVGFSEKPSLTERKIQMRQKMKNSRTAPSSLQELCDVQIKEEAKAVGLAEIGYGAERERVDSGGDRVDSGGDTVESGGDRVESGGDRVDSGGDTVESGGDRVDSGGDTLVLGDKGFDVGGVRVKREDVDIIRGTEYDVGRVRFSLEGEESVRRRGEPSTSQLT